MGGLLKQLQKRKAEVGHALNDVLVRPENPSSSGSGRSQIMKPAETRMLDGAAENLLEADRALKDIISEATKHSSGSYDALTLKDSGSIRVIRSKKERAESKVSSSQLGMKIPWWLTTSSTEAPQIELLMDAARDGLATKLNNDRSDEWPVVVKTAVGEAFHKLSNQFRLSKKDSELATSTLMKIVAGQGPLGPLFSDNDVTEIFIDNHKTIKVTRNGQAIDTPFSFHNSSEYTFYIQRILRGRAELSASNPIIDFVLDDEWKTQVNLLHPSLSGGGEVRMCFRIPRLQHVTFYDALQSKVLPATVAAWLTELVTTREANILLVGQAGSGKTMMASAFISAAGSTERIIVVEDKPEINATGGNIEKLVARTSPLGGEADVRAKDLLQAALRRSPHRLVIGELTEEVSLPFLRALEGGQSGSFATIHAHSSIDGLWRFLDLLSSSSDGAAPDALMRRIARSINIIVTMGRVDDQSCLLEISEVLPPSGGEFRTLPLVKLDGVFDGKRRWKKVCTESVWLAALEKRGTKLTAGSGLVIEGGELSENVASDKTLATKPSEQKAPKTKKQNNTDKGETPV